MVRLGDGERGLKIDAWKMRREKLSAAFDAECHALAKEFIAFQKGQIKDAIARYKSRIESQRLDDSSAQPQPFLVVDQKELNQMALSIRKMQEVGRMALGETTDRKQLDLDFGSAPNIQVTVVHERPGPAPDSQR